MHLDTPARTSAVGAGSRQRPGDFWASRRRRWPGAPRVRSLGLAGAPTEIWAFVGLVALCCASRISSFDNVARFPRNAGKSNPIAIVSLVTAQLPRRSRRGRAGFGSLSVAIARRMFDDQPSGRFDMISGDKPAFTM